MKKVFTLFVLVALAMSFTTVAFADAGEKFQGGIEKIVKSPMNVPNSIQEEYDVAEFKPWGVLGGFSKGLFYFGYDFVTGFIDVLTFPVDLGD